MLMANLIKIAERVVLLQSKEPVSTEEWFGSGIQDVEGGLE